MTYKIVRRYFNNGTGLVLRTGLSLAQAQAHCSNPETNSRTCTNPDSLSHTRQYGPWFDVYYREQPDEQNESEE